MKKVILMAAISLAAVSCNKTDKTTTDTTVESTTTGTTGMTGDSLNTAPATTTTTANANASADVETAKKFAEGGMMEVQLGNLAQKNGSNAKVKEFGKMMVTDHSKKGDELKALATKKGWTLPTELGAEKKAKYYEMAAKKGADFDKAYATFMVEDHKKDIEEYTKASTSAADADFKAFATNTLPTLKHHLEMAQQAETATK